MKKNLLILGTALTMLLTLCACSGQTRTTDTLEQPEQLEQPETEVPAAPEPRKEPEWTLDPADITDDYAADTLICLPELALSGLGFTFDSPRELTAEFAFAGGSTASLVWFYRDGGLVYNKEFSRLPGEAAAAGTD